MNAMRKSAAILLYTLIFACTGSNVAFAAALPLKPEWCPNPKPVEIDPDTQKEQVITVPLSTSQTEIEKITKRISGCPSACYDLTTTVTIDEKISYASLTPKIDTTSKLVLKTKASNLCKDENKKNPAAEGRGCPPAQKNEPRITIVLEENKILTFDKQVIGPKSRCDDKLPGLVGSAYGKIQSSDKAGLLHDLKTLGELKQAPERSVGSVNGAAELAKAFGISEAKANQLTTNKPDLVARLNEAIRTGDESTAKQIASELGLNPNLASEAVRLQASSPTGDPSTEITGNKQSPTAQSTILEGSQQSSECDNLCRSAQIIKYMESSGRYGISTCSKNICVHGAYQIRTENVLNWTCEVGQCASVGQFLQNPELQDQVFRHKFGQYAQQYGGYTAAAQAWLGGPGSVGKYGRADAFGTTVGSYAARFAHMFGDPNFTFSGRDTTIYGVQTQGVASPFGNLSNLFTNIIPRSSAPVGASPFSRVTPVGYPSSVSQPTLGTQPTPIRSPIGTVSPTGQLVSLVAPSQTQEISPANTLLRALQPPGTKEQEISGSVQAVATLIVQPSEIMRGKSLVVSWSTVGMSTAAPCNVILQVGASTSVIARGNEGSQDIKTTADTELGVWHFTLQCTAQTDGRHIQQTASASVR